MSKENIVEIPSGSGNRYRYVYEDGATKYLGPVGSAPDLAEEEFLRAWTYGLCTDESQDIPPLPMDEMGFSPFVKQTYMVKDPFHHLVLGEGRTPSIGEIGTPSTTNIRVEPGDLIDVHANHRYLVKDGERYELAPYKDMFLASAGPMGQEPLCVPKDKVYLYDETPQPGWVETGTFDRWVHRTRYVVTKAGEWRCPECGRKFKSKRARSIHMSKKHKRAWR